MPRYCRILNLIQKRIYSYLLIYWNLFGVYITYLLSVTFIILNINYLGHDNGIRTFSKDFLRQSGAFSQRQALSLQLQVRKTEDWVLKLKS